MKQALSPGILLRFSVLLLVAPCLPAFAQEQPVPASQPSHTAPADLHLAVVVTGKHDTPAEQVFSESAFTLLDNGAPQPIKSFRHVGSDAPVSVLILIDAVNAPYIAIANERQQLDKYLSANNGELPRPTSFAILSDKGLQIQPTSTRDGKSIMTSLDAQTTSLRVLGRSTGFYGAEERLDTSLTALRTLIAREGELPGRKLVLFISPGWALFTGPRIQLTGKQQRGVFAQLVELTRQLQQANITLYSIDPRGTGQSIESRFYYQQFLKGVAQPDKADFADLSLQVLATHSGGLVLNSNNNIDDLVRDAVKDAAEYYDLSFAPAVAEHPGEYHSIEVKVAQPGLNARTRQAYYAQP